MIIQVIDESRSSAENNTFNVAFGRTVLTKEQLINYNHRMLNLGEPNVYDGHGYNKIHFPQMMKLAGLERLSDKQALWIAKSLKLYVNTQLTEIKDVIDDTIQYYLACSSSKVREDNVIQVAGHNKDSITLLWQFNDQFNKSLKAMNLGDRFHLDWQRTRGAWLLRVSWTYVDELVAIFQQIGLNCINIKKIKRK